MFFRRCLSPVLTLDWFAWHAKGFVYSGRGEYPAEDLDDLEDLEDLEEDDNHHSETDWGEDQDQDQEEIEISARRRHRFTDNRNAFVLEVRCIALRCHALPCVALRCLALPCVALRCLAFFS